MAWREEVIRDATDYTNKEVFAYAWKSPEQREQETPVDDDDEGVGFALDDSGDRSLEENERIDGEGTTHAADQYDNTQGRGPPSETEVEQSELEAEREAHAQTRRERDEARAVVNDRSRQQAAENAEAGTQFVLNNPEQAVAMISQQQAIAQQQFAARAAESNAYGRAKYGEQDFTAACNIIGQEMQANPGYVQAMRAEIASAPNMADKVWEMAERISTRGAGARSSSRFPASPGMNMRGFGGAAAAAAAAGGRADEDVAGWNSRGTDVGDEMEIFRHGFSAPHYLLRDDR
jgi:hypothetical protein